MGRQTPNWNEELIYVNEKSFDKLRHRNIKMKRMKIKDAMKANRPNDVL